MSWFEKKFGRYAVRNLSLIMSILYALGILLGNFPNVLSYMFFNPNLIFHKFQIWRLFTWILVPDQGFNVLFALIAVFFFYSISTSLESAWGTYRYNVYIFSGILFTVLSGLIVYGITVIMGNSFIWDIYLQYYFSVFYIMMSVFFALAVTFPDSMILLFFIIPIKMKYIGIIYGILMLYEMISYLVVGNWYACIVMFASMLNFLIFFFTQRKRIFGNKRRTQRMQTRFSSQSATNANVQSTRPQNSAVTRHKCAICGKTDVSNPELSFRFCSKCNGNYEYCQEHLFTHPHVQ